MSVRLICLILCVGILHISAFPTPEDTTADYEIYGTQDPSAVTEDLFEGAESSVDSVTESEDNSEPETSTDESIGQDSGNVEHESNIDEVSSSPSEPEPESNTNEESAAVDPKVEAESPNDDNQEKSDSENEVSNSNESSEGETVDIDPANAQSNETDIINTHEDGPEDSDGSDNRGFTVVRDLYVYGTHIQVAEKEKENEKIFCQILRDLSSGAILDKRCVTIKKPVTVIIGENLMDGVFGTGGDLYTCQEIITNSGGTVQELCVTHDTWFYLMSG